MPDSENPLSQPPGSTPSEMFPVLTSAQQARVLARGQRRTAEQGEIVVELNQQVNRVFVVMSGQLHALQVANNRESIVAICNPGMFTGELTVLRGRRGLLRIRAREKSELIEIEREELQAPGCITKLVLQVYVRSSLQQCFDGLGVPSSVMISNSARDSLLLTSTQSIVAGFRDWLARTSGHSQTRFR